MNPFESMEEIYKLNDEYSILNKNGRCTKSTSSYEAISKAIAKDWKTHQKGKRPIENTSIDRRRR